MQRSYKSREEAGKILAEFVKKLNLNAPYLLAIPRGGVQVAEGIADELKIPIDIIISKKLPVPNNEETAFGAVTRDGTSVVGEVATHLIHLTQEEIDKIAQKVILEVKHRAKIYGDFDENRVRNSDVIIVDDGIATGYSMMAAVNSVRNYNPASVTVAVPVSAYDACEKIKNAVDNFVCPITEEIYFFAVGNYYEKWTDLEEDDILRILETYRQKYP